MWFPLTPLPPPPTPTPTATEDAGSQMDMPKSRTENFERFLPSAAAGGILRVHDRA